MKKLGFVLICLVVMATSCTKEHYHGENVVLEGPKVQVHDGNAWTWITTSKFGTPEAMAIVIDDAALNSVPIGEHAHEGGRQMHEGGNNYILKFHKRARILPFDHVGLDWNPNGHIPEPIYGKPHFDFHFYMTSEEDVAAIPAYEVDSAKFLNWPAPEYFPLNYLNGGGGEAKMGTHWVDVNSPEFNGGAFTQTFIYGSYDGQVSFYEPMITLEFLKSTNSFVRSIPQSEKFARNGYYPTRMSLTKHDGLTELILDRFVYREPS